MKLGKPSLFITMTCNANSSQIKQNIFENQTSWDRFDVVDDVFKLKIDRLIFEIKNKEIFGKVIGYVAAIENQKRGLPHIHLLIILDNSDKMDSPKKIDQVVWAHIPDKKEYPQLYEKVLKFMIHRPCKNKKDSICYKGDKCSKQFPKKYQAKTEIINGYPIYKRGMKNKIE